MAKLNEIGDGALLDELVLRIEGLTPQRRAQLAQIAEASRIIGKAARDGVEETVAGYRAPAIISAESLVEQLGLEEGYAHAMATHEAFGLAKPNEIPDFGAVLKTFTPEMLHAAKGFQHPELVLPTKGRSFSDLVSAMDGHKTMPRQSDVYVNDFLHKHHKKPKNWSAYIVEAPTVVDVYDFDDLDLTLGNRIERFANHKKENGVNGMDRMTYSHLMMQKLQTGEPIDQEFWTMLDEDLALSNSHVPFADWSLDRRGVVFGSVRPVHRYGDARFRRSVGGDMQAA